MNLQRLRGEIYANFPSQAAFARHMQWHPNKIIRLLSGVFVPNVEEAGRIAAALGLSEKAFCEIFLAKQSPNGD